MFSKNLVMAVKVGGKVLREFDGTVALPFGSEYTILLKNLSTQRASVKVSIDGQDATDGVSLIINAGESLELKRFVKNGNLNAGNAFKFIEKTAQIEAYRGNKAEDGLLTVTYEFENVYASFNDPYKGLVEKLGGSSWSTTTTQTSLNYDGKLIRGSSSSAQQYASNCIMKMSATASAKNSTLQNTAGITAPGSIVEQEFQTVYGFRGDGYKHTMTMKMIGSVKGREPVKEAVVVKKLQRCLMCGTNTKQTAKFCHNCGASVQII